MEENANSVIENNNSLGKISDINKVEEKDKTFNTLRRIQNLLKKESALKKLCKKND